MATGGTVLGDATRQQGADDEAGHHADEDAEARAGTGGGGARRAGVAVGGRNRSSPDTGRGAGPHGRSSRPRPPEVFL